MTPHCHKDEMGTPQQEITSRQVKLGRLVSEVSGTPVLFIYPLLVAPVRRPEDTTCQIKISPFSLSQSFLYYHYVDIVLFYHIFNAGF